MKTIISKFFFALVLTIYVNTTFAQQEASGTFRYPFLPGDELWQKYETHRERVAALQIPADILPRLTTKELLQVCLDYPYLLDFLFGDDLQSGMEILFSEFNGFQELLKRKDAGSVFLEECGNFTNMTKTFESVTGKERGRYSFKEIVLGMLIAQDEIIDCIQEDQMKTLAETMHENLSIKDLYPQTFSKMNKIPTYLFLAKSAIKRKIGVRMIETDKLLEIIKSPTLSNAEAIENSPELITKIVKGI